MSLKYAFMSGGGCRLLKNYDLAANRKRTLRTENCGVLEQRAYASREFGAERKMLTSFVVVRGDGDEQEEIWVARVLLLCRCPLKGYTEALKLGTVQYMECVRPLDAVDETLKFLCLRWAATDGENDDS